MAPELGVARRLIARGHEVHVLADPTVAEAAVSVGCGFSPWQRAPHRSLDPSPAKSPDVTAARQALRRAKARIEAVPGFDRASDTLNLARWMRDAIVAGPAADYASDTVDVIDAFQPDVVVADAMLFGAMIAAQARNIPVAALVPNIWLTPAPGAPLAGPGFPVAASRPGRIRDAALGSIGQLLFRSGLAPINAARARYELEPLESVFDQAMTAERILVLTSPDFDIASAAAPPNTRFVGPIYDDPEWVETWNPPWPAENQAPLVLVAFSTTDQNQVPLLGRIVDALSTLPVRAVVTLGNAIEPGAVLPARNVEVVASAPHSHLLNEAALVVSHCGHGTTIKTIASGVPLVCIPMGRDQNDTAARVIHHGAGVRLWRSASTARIREAVQRVLADPGYRLRAARLAALIGDGAHTSDVITELEALA